jgi:mRNA interferase MazF
MKPGEVALAEVQQSDGKLKARPVLILCLMPPFSDLLVCALSSKLHNQCRGFDEVIAVQDDDFVASGLKVASLIRLGMLATLPAAAILGRIGAVSTDRLRRLRSAVARHIDPART